MVAGDTLFVLRPGQFFSSSDVTPAAWNVRNRRPHLAFFGTVTVPAYYQGTMPRHFDGGGITLTILWTTASATSGTCRWRARLERYDTGVAISGASFGTQIEVTGTAPASAGNAIYTEIPFSSSEIDSLAAGDAFRLEIDRQHDDAEDTITTFIELYAVEGRET